MGRLPGVFLTVMARKKWGQKKIGVRPQFRYRGTGPDGEQSKMGSDPIFPQFFLRFTSGKKNPRLRPLHTVARAEAEGGFLAEIKRSEASHFDKELPRLTARLRFG